MARGHDTIGASHFEDQENRDFFIDLLIKGDHVRRGVTCGLYKFEHFRNLAESSFSVPEWPTSAQLYDAGGHG